MVSDEIILCMFVVNDNAYLTYLAEQNGRHRTKWPEQTKFKLPSYLHNWNLERKNALVWITSIVC